MKLTGYTTIGIRVLFAAALVGATYGSGCTSWTGGIVRNFNPCGTLLNCDPMQYDWMFIGDNYPNWEIDPTCTIPGACAGQTGTTNQNQ